MVILGMSVIKHFIASLRTPMQEDVILPSLQAMLYTGKIKKIYILEIYLSYEL